MAKLDTTKAFMKYGNENEGKFRDVGEFVINGKTFEERFARMEQLEESLLDLIEQLKGHYIVKEDTPYIVNIDNKAVYVDKLEVLKVVDTKLPLSFYKIENGKVVIDNKKVGAL